jgi:hypothetical protein
MYSRSDIAVDKGLGFDFSDIAGIVKSALPATLNIFQNQMQLKQVKAMNAAGVQGGYAMPQYGPYGQQITQLPLAQSFMPQPTFGGQYPQPSSGMSTTTMALIGAATLVVALVAFKALK